MNEKRIVSVELSNGKLFVTTRVKSAHFYCSYPAQPCADDIFREEYASVDGEIKLIKCIKGVHTPATLVQEKFQFND